MPELLAAEKAATGQLIDRLVQIGTWYRLDFLGLFAQREIELALFGGKRPADRSFAVGLEGVQFTPYVGISSSFLGSGSDQPFISAPMNTGALDGCLLQKDFNCFGHWCETETSADSAGDTGTENFTINSRSSAGRVRSRNGSDVTQTMDVAVAKGLHISRRRVSTEYEQVHIAEDGTITRQTYAQSTMATVDALQWILGATNFHGATNQYSTRRCSIHWAGAWWPENFILPTFRAFRRWRLAMAELAA